MQKKHYYILFALTLVVYVVNLFVDVMAVDAAQYAEISWEMFTTKSFLQVHSYGADYLDKPPLLFWLNSLSFWVFGIGTVSYKLPSLLFAILAVYSTYRFARLFYTEQVALTAALMLATSEALFLITNDVRTDTILMGSVIFAIWQWAAFFETNKTVNIILGSIGLGLALLAKGPIGLIALALSFLPHIILARKWRWLIDIRMIIGIVIIALMLTPMCIGLYQQWSWHGLKFYFWTQSFGRITGGSEWNNNPDTFFLLHTNLWAFLPWTLFLFVGWFDIVRGFIRRKIIVREVISVSGFTLVLIALMLSRYQLPHYIFVVYPLAAVMAAGYYHRAESQPTMKKVLALLQIFTLILLILGSCVFQYCFKGLDSLSLSCLIVLYLAVIIVSKYTAGPIKNLRNAFLYIRHSFSSRKILPAEAHVFFDYIYRHLLLPSAGIMIVFNLLVGAFYFPAILRYQPGDDFGRYVRQHEVSQAGYVAYFCQYGYADVFYAHQRPAFVWDADALGKMLQEKKHLYIMTTPDGVHRLGEAHIKYKIIDERYRYPVAKLTWTFLHPYTRESVCDKVYLVEADR